jgi:hypothetical protein
MFMWDFRDLQLMRASSACEDRQCMRSAAHKQLWNARDMELATGADRRLMALVRTSVSDEAVFEIVL